MKWVSFLVVAAIVIALLWHFGVLHAVGGAFDDWLRLMASTFTPLKSVITMPPRSP